MNSTRFFPFTDYVSEGFSATVAETLEISAKSIRTLLRTILILILFSEEPELSETFSEILKIVGKSILTLYNGLIILKNVKSSNGVHYSKNC
ncbi:MAG: hypothetical protein NTX75_05805 [Proteobacteria bacterium]|nr:hypothetical protein [Pseudomonadota bacterium]